MKRYIKLLLLISVASFALACPPAWSDALSYCDVYAQDYAANHQSEDVSSQTLYASAHKDCLTAYGQQPVKKDNTEAIPPTPDQDQEKATSGKTRNDKWMKSCAARYKSFNPKTGSYRTRSGKWRSCPDHP